MRILIVTQYFWPENFRINDLCQELIKRNNSVTILTGYPNYPSGNLDTDFRNNPSNFSYYKGANIIRIPIMLRGRGRGARLLFNYLSYVLSAAFVGSFKLREKKFDVVFVYGPSPITVCIPALVLKKIKKIPTVLWVLDLWPETLEAVGVVKSQLILKTVGYMVRYIYNRCDLILGQSKAFFSGIERYCDIPTKIKYFPSWSEDVFNKSNVEVVESITKDNTSLKILFAGNIGEAQDFNSVLKAMQLLKTRKIDIKLYIVGDGRAYNWLCEEIVKQSLSEYIVLLGRHPLEQMPSFYASVDVLLATLKNSKVFEMTIPGKVQTYMAAGKPILTMLSGEGSRVVEEAKCGLVANSGDFQQLALNIECMLSSTRNQLEKMGKNARLYARAEFDRDRLISQLEGWFEEVAIKKTFEKQV